MPKIWNASNLTQVTWAHAVNSRAELQQAFDDGVDMIECDIVFGTIIGDETLTEQPVMGHPPANTSDITLEEFLIKIKEFNSNTANKRGVKLDFKSTSVFVESTKILESLWGSMDYPVWLNADIIRGPVNNIISIPVDANTFLNECKKFPDAVLSIGWTTRWGSDFSEGSYTNNQVDKMIQAIQTNQITHPITFPIRAGIAANSKEELTRLYQSLNTTNSLSFTIWSSNGDFVNVLKLEDLIFHFGLDIVYLDVPNELSDKLNLGRSNGNESMKVSYWINLGLLFLYILFTMFD